MNRKMTRLAGQGSGSLDGCGSAEVERADLLLLEEARQ